MATARIEYIGNLATKCVHVQSGKEIYTDAPKDNNGKGENFSPTDLIATAYASCVITTIGIYCLQKNINFEHATAQITKVMNATPRRIGQLIFELDLSKNIWTDIQKEKIERVAKTCPVAKSLHETIDIAMEILF